MTCVSAAATSPVRSSRRSAPAAACGVVALLVLAGCGTTDEASRQTLPPLETTTTTTTTTTTIPLERFVTVERGDILAVIAAEQGVTVESIVELNGLSSPDAIQAGQVLEMPENRISPVVVTEAEAPDDTTADDDAADDSADDDS